MKAVILLVVVMFCSFITFHPAKAVVLSKHSAQVMTRAQSYYGSAQLTKSIDTVKYELDHNHVPTLDRAIMTAELGYFYYENQDFENAYLTYARASELKLAAQMPHQQDLRTAALLALTLKDYQLASRHFADLISENDPVTNTNDMKNLVFSLFNSKLYEEASHWQTKLFAEYTKQGTTISSSLWQLKATIDYKLENYQAVAIAYGKALETTPSEKLCQTAIYSYLRAGMFDQAILTMQQLVESWPDNKTFSPLHIDLLNQDTAKLQASKQALLQLDKSDNLGLKPMRFAVMYGLKSSVSALQAMGWDIEGTDSDPLLYVAADFDQFEMVEFLLSQNVPLKLHKDTLTKQFSAILIEANQHELIRKILRSQEGFKVFLDSQMLSQTAFDGNEKAYFFLKSLGVIAPPDNQDVNKMLVGASYAGSLAIAKDLVMKEGANPVAEAYDTSALIVAVSQQQYDLVDFFLSHDFDVNVSLSNDLTALVKAAELGDKILIRALIAAGANVNQKGYNGFTPLNVAAGLKRYEVLPILLEAGAKDSIDTPNDYGDIPLNQLASQGANESIELLLAQDASIDGNANAAVSPLMSAILNQREYTVKLLLDRGASVTMRQQDKYNLLTLAMFEVNAAIAQQLIDAGLPYENAAKFLAGLTYSDVNRFLKRNGYKKTKLDGAIRWTQKGSDGESHQIELAKQKGAIGLPKMLIIIRQSGMDIDSWLASA